MNPLDPATLPLRDIHLPMPVDWWPPAPGWWLVALVVASLVAAGVVRWRRDRFRRFALARLRAIRAALAEGAPATRCAQEVAELLRRYCMTTTADPAQVAGLVGAPWLAYLDSRWPRGGFAGAAGQLLLDLPYAARAEPAAAATLVDLGIEWLEAQRGRRPSG